MSCAECLTPVFRTSKTRPAYACGACYAALCGAHAHYYVDGSGHGFERGVPPMCEVCMHDYENRNTLTVDNLLSSGDYIHRVTARARFRVALTPDGSQVRTFALGDAGEERA